MGFLCSPLRRRSGTAIGRQIFSGARRSPLSTRILFGRMHGPLRDDPGLSAQLGLGLHRLPGERDYDKDSAWFSAEQIYGDSTGGVISVADNYPEAARKHVLDSEALLSVNRYDGAGYLAGYAVECTLKTLILVETGQGGGGHNLNDLSARALQLAGLANQKTAAYVQGPQLTSLTYGPPAGWYEYRRYEPEGTITQADSSAWVAEARRLHDTVIAKMKFDGVIA
jgi:hypothetical protein